MSNMVLATPFHLRAAQANRDNVWTSRNGFTLAMHYTGSAEEALAARARVIIADLSWRWRVAVAGRRSAEMLARILTRNPAKLGLGEAFKAAWLNEGGAVRGTGVVARAGADIFVVASAAPDPVSFRIAAAEFNVRIHELTGGGLAIVGPYARYLLNRAGLNSALELLQVQRVHWNGIDVTLSRWGEHGGYELWCKSSDALVVWDRLVQAGEPFGVTLAGLGAMDVLDIEAGVARPERDYDPARIDSGEKPSPQSLGLERLIDIEHRDFKGRARWLALRQTDQCVLAGVELDGDEAATNTPLMRGNRCVGHTIASCYSPALRRAIALAQVETAFSAPGMKVTLTLGPTRDERRFRCVDAHMVSLPFLAAPTPIVA
ncbi:MAG: aminomethyltransferase family protein [Alphaproteobacteria bacterium]|nr:aminomethyltransferase family protein [Alphaproteobacteria bacterium]